MMKINQSSDIQALFKTLGIKASNPSYSTGVHWNGLKKEKVLEVSTPISNEVIGMVEMLNEPDYEKVIKTAQQAFDIWRTRPAPQRGEIVRQYGIALRKYKIECNLLNVTVEKLDKNRLKQYIRNHCCAKSKPVS